MSRNFASLPYEEPGVVTILIQSSSILLFNVVNSIIYCTLYCRLLGQVLIGITWGTPGAKWIPHNAEEAVVHLGYIGLIFLVYEGVISAPYNSDSTSPP